MDKRKLKVLVFSSLLFILFFTIGTFLIGELQYCMDVLLISESKVCEYAKTTTIDISLLTFNGEKIAVDATENTIYISQAPDKLSHYTLLQGRLDSMDASHSLYFVKNSAMDDISSSVQNGTPLSLIIFDENGCQPVQVVITTLPVLKMDGEIAYKSEEDRDVLTGFVTLWSGLDPLTEEYSTKSSNLEWHVRGNTTSAASKKPWKLSLKNEKGENNDLNFLGLGEDDDWILNSLTMDDTKIKEKLFMDMWNTIAEETNHNFQMSTGEFIEVIVNGEYMGIYLLQRRLDAKYLELADTDVILKGGARYDVASVEEAYEFVTPEMNSENIYAIMRGVFERQNSSSYNLYNVIDVNLMLQLASAVDNFGIKNMYHVLKKSDNSYEHFLVPWDTDMSFGVVYKDIVGFCYDYELSIGSFAARMETPALQKVYPEYDQKVAERWRYLRQTILKEDNIVSYADELHGQLRISGAYARDVSKWPDRYGGADTINKLKDFVLARIAFMDEYYS